MQREQTMHLLGSKKKNGLDESIPRLTFDGSLS